MSRARLLTQARAFPLPCSSSLQKTTLQQRPEQHPTSPALLQAYKQALLKAVQLLPPDLDLALW